jgi:hypothetical protein
MTLAVAPDDTSVIDELNETIERLRDVNRKLHKEHRRKIKQLELELEIAVLQAQRPYLKPWEQRQITEAIDALHEGNKYPDCAPITRLLMGRQWQST